MSDKGEFDFETYSEAGYVWNEATRKFEVPKAARKKGLNTVGANVYSEHPSTEVLTLSYKLPAFWVDVSGGPRIGGYKRRWKPGDPPPQDLFDYLAAGGVLEAHNVMFERLIWANVCVPKYGWPSLEPYRYQLRCSMATARVNSLPGPLGELGTVLGLTLKKDADGKRLLDKFSVPRNPTKADPRTRIRPQDDPDDAERLYGYCDRDIDAEAEASGVMRPMDPAELLFWWVDQEINWRGIAVDRDGLHNCMAVLEQALERYGEEYREITGLNPTQLEATKGWLAAKGLRLYSMDEDSVEEALKNLPPPPPGVVDPRRRVLEIRQLIGSASVKKIYAMDHQASRDDRLRNLIVHHGARTGRPTGEGPQPLNLPKSGPELVWCGVARDRPQRPGTCGRPYRPSLDACPWCSAPKALDEKKTEWSAKAAVFVLEIMAARSLELVEWFFGDAVLCIMGCVRGLFVAGPGHDLIASDYSAIEAVVTAMLSKCEWRIQTFRDKKDIYLESAAKITGRTAAEYAAYKAEHGVNHPDRQKVGKVAELALGFMGWIAAWRQFDDSPTFTDQEVKQKILAWRDASPEIPELAGGQTRGAPWDRDCRPECYGFEGAAVQAITFPGNVFTVAGVTFHLEGYEPPRMEPVSPAWWMPGDPILQEVGGKLGALIITLPSGRRLTYHQPRLAPATRAYAAHWEKSITYMTWNTNPKYGPTGWVPMSTYAGKLIENIVQAIAHDILRFAILNLRAAGYHTVLHVYDEIVVEVPEGCGSLEEVERIMGIMPPWAQGWPVRASGGWRGKRYRKD